MVLGTPSAQTALEPLNIGPYLEAVSTVLDLQSNIRTDPAGHPPAVPSVY